jgi:PadR family transcriptional regulator, regulatory protein PadR
MSTTVRSAVRVHDGLACCPRCLDLYLLPTYSLDDIYMPSAAPRETFMGQGLGHAGQGGGGMHEGNRPCCRRTGGAAGGALVEPATLAALLTGGSHGYDIRREIGELTDGAIELDTGGLYRVLRRLEDEGFVVSEWAKGESGPQRRNYAITGEGRELAEDWLARLRERQRVAGLLADVLSAALKQGKS